MGKENKINMTHYCQELFQWSIQAIHVVLRLKQRNNVITAAGRHLPLEVLLTGVREMDRINNPKPPDRKNKQMQNMFAFNMRCKIHVPDT